MRSLFISCTDFLPRMSNHDSSDLAFMLTETQSGILVYENHRDFLSAPRAHTVLRLHFTETPFFCSGGQLLDDTQWDDIDSLGIGIYRCQYSHAEALEHWHYVFFSPSLIFECIIEDAVFIDTVYGNASSFLALKQYLI